MTITHGSVWGLYQSSYYLGRVRKNGLFFALGQFATVAILQLLRLLKRRLSPHREKKKRSQSFRHYQNEFQKKADDLFRNLCNT